MKRVKTWTLPQLKDFNMNSSSMKLLRFFYISNLLLTQQFLHIIILMMLHFYMLRIVRRKDKILKQQNGEQSDYLCFICMKLFERCF